MPTKSVRGARAAALTLAMLAGVTGCALRHVARTVGRGNTEVALAVGGPLQSQVGGVVAPLPEHRLSVRHGATDGLDVGGSVALAPLASGLLVLDVGIVAQIFREAGGLAISTSVRLDGVIDISAPVGPPRVYPEVGLHAEHILDRHLLVFGGLLTLAQLDPPPGRPPIYLTPYLGFEVLVGVHGLSLAAGWISPWEDSRSIVPWEPAGYGVITVHLGWRVRVGGLDR